MEKLIITSIYLLNSEHDSENNVYFIDLQNLEIYKSFAESSQAFCSNAIIKKQEVCESKYVWTQPQTQSLRQMFTQLQGSWYLDSGNKKDRIQTLSVPLDYDVFSSWKPGLSGLNKYLNNFHMDWVNED